MNAEYNPFAAELAAMKDKLKSNSVLKDSMESALSWYAQFDLDGTSAQLNRLQAALRKSNDRLEKLTSEYSNQQSTVSALERKARPGLNPTYWLSTERRVAGRMHEEAVQRLRQLKREFIEHQEKKNNCTREAQGLQESLARYRAFDVLQAKDMVRFSELEQSTLKDAVAVLSRRAQDAELVLRPVWVQLQEAIQQEKKLNAQLSDALRLDAQLSDATDGWTRKQIHLECEEKFGDGIPNKVIQRLKRQHRKAESDIKKNEKLLNRLKKRLTQDIRTVVIDGSNLLFHHARGMASDQFIGLTVLNALVPALASKYKIILFFDASAPRRLNMKRSDLRAHFSDWTDEVSFAPPTIEADETILAVLKNNPYAVAISKDRYSERGSEAALEDRRFVPEISDGVLYLHDLFMEVPVALN